MRRLTHSKHPIQGGNTMTTEATEIVTTTMRVLKRDTCPSSSGRSELSYQIGCNEEEELYFMVYKNSGKGFFNSGWQSLKSIMALLEETPYPITGATLLPLYNRLSINTSYFLLVCLLNEGIVERWKRIYKLTDIEPFMAKMKGLIASKDDKKDPLKKKKSTKPAQKKAS
jgi:hypothetical protein